MKKTGSARVYLMVIIMAYCTGMNAQIGSDERSVMKSEMVKMPLGEYNDNNNDLNYALISTRPHLPVFISTDTKTRQLKIELNEPDNDRLTIIISDAFNNKIISKVCKCKRCIKIGVNKIKCDTFKVNIYHKEGGFLLASQEIRKNIN